jgi:hypothetical protein
VFRPHRVGSGWWLTSRCGIVVAEENSPPWGIPALVPIGADHPRSRASVWGLWGNSNTIGAKSQPHWPQLQPTARLRRTWNSSIKKSSEMLPVARHCCSTSFAFVEANGHLWAAW